MSQIQVDNIYNKDGDGSPGFPLGANVTGVITATTFKGGAEITSGTISATSVTATTGSFTSNVSVGGTLTYEDVTNIDSVGVITARQGVKVSAGGVDVTAGGVDVTAGGINVVGVVTATNDIKANGNIVGDNSTNISGVSSVTATTYYGSGANLGGIDAAPQVKLNTTGSLSAGDATIINTDGTVSKAKTTIEGKTAITATAEQQYWSNGNYPAGVHIPGTDKYIFCEQDGTTGNAGQIRVYTKNGTTLTGGTYQHFEGGSTTNINVIWDAGNSRAIVFYCDAGNNNDFKCRVCSISGTNITMGAITDVAPGGTNQTIMTNWKRQGAFYDPDSGKIVVAWVDAASNGNAKACVCTVNNLSITFGALSTFATGYVESVKCAYDTANNKVVALVRKGSSGDVYMTSYVGTVSGTSLSWGSAVNVETTQTGPGEGIVYMTEQQKSFCIFSNGNDGGRVYSKIGTVSGTSITWGAAVKCGTNNNTSIVGSHSMDVVYDTYSKLPALTWRASNNNDSIMSSAMKSFDGTTPTFSNIIEINGGQAASVPNILTTDSADGPIVIYKEGSPLKWTQVNISETTTNVTGQNFLGFSADTYSNGNEATIKLSGNTDNNQVGLTTGQSYYVQNDGTLGLAAASPSVYGGKAVSSTKIVVAGPDAPPSGGLNIIASWDFGADYGQNYFEHTGLTTSSYIKYQLEISELQFVGNVQKKLGFRIYKADGSLETGSNYNFMANKKTLVGNSNFDFEGQSGQSYWQLCGTSNNDRAYYDGTVEWKNPGDLANKQAPTLVHAQWYQNYRFVYDDVMYLNNIGNAQFVSGFRIYNITDSTNLARGRAVLYGYKLS